MSDIVERLRNDQGIGINLTLCREAADEIERLRARIAALREALALFACDCAPKIECVDPSNCRNSIARAALAKREK